MTSPLDTAFAHRLLLAHLQAATSIATTFQNLPPFTPQLPQQAHHPLTTTPPSPPRPARHTPPPLQPQPSFSRSRSPPPAKGKPFMECKPEPSPSHTPTSPHQFSPHRHKSKATHQHKTIQTSRNSVHHQSQRFLSPVRPIHLHKHHQFHRIRHYPTFTTCITSTTIQASTPPHGFTTLS